MCSNAKLPKRLPLVLAATFGWGCGAPQAPAEVDPGMQPASPSPEEGAPGQASRPDSAGEPGYLSWRLEECALGPIDDAGASQTAAAFSEALGETATVEEYQAEGEVLVRAVMSHQGERTISATPGSYGIHTSRIIGPGGVHVGMAAEEAVGSLGPNAPCVRGADDGADDVMCFARPGASLTLVFGQVPVLAIS